MSRIVATSVMKAMSASPPELGHTIRSQSRAMNRASMNYEVERPHRRRRPKGSYRVGYCGRTSATLKETSRASLLNPFEEMFDVAFIPGSFKKYVCLAPKSRALPLGLLRQHVFTFRNAYPC